MKLRVVVLCLISSTGAPACREEPPETASSPARATSNVRRANDATRPSSGAPAPFPVRWSRELGLRALTDVEQRLAARNETEFAELRHGEATAQPASCQEWLALHARAYRPAGGLDDALDRAAMIRCQTLSILKDGQPAQTSHLRGLLWDHTLLPLLPASIATADNLNRERVVKAASDAGKTLKQLDPKARAKPVAGDASLVILESGRRAMISLHGEAWGDFNRDGVDDLVMSVVNGSTQGDFSYARLMTLTRTTADESLVPIDLR